MGPVHHVELSNGWNGLLLLLLLLLPFLMATVAGLLACKAVMQRLRSFILLSKELLRFFFFFGCSELTSVTCNTQILKLVISKVLFLKYHLVYISNKYESTNAIVV